MRELVADNAGLGAVVASWAVLSCLCCWDGLARDKVDVRERMVDWGGGVDDWVKTADWVS